jgi:ferric-dicitrate binding protein FerR (iron transport regulator)
MIRCPNCGTLNLKSNTLCYRCGNTLWRPTQPAVPARAGAAAPAARPARSEPPRRAGVPGWLLTILVALSIVLLSLLSMLTGLLLANGSLASLFA